MRKYYFITLIICGACTNNINSKPKDGNILKATINVQGATIKARFVCPNGFTRNQYADTSFGYYLENLPLKKWGTKVAYFNGTFKEKNNVYISVIDKAIGVKDLHQCADATMYLWADYLFVNKKFNQIQFKFLGDNAWHNYWDWCGGKVTKTNFFKYMEQVWSAANTKSLSTQVKPITLANVTIGDILLQTGNPYGHALMIVDVCENKTTKEKKYMLAQSYMPAQETQVLINPNSVDDANKVWFTFKEGEPIITPEWEFTTADFKRF